MCRLLWHLPELEKLELLAELENEFGPREAEDSGGLAEEPAIPVELQELLKDEKIRY